MADPSQPAGGYHPAMPQYVPGMAPACMPVMAPSVGQPKPVAYTQQYAAHAGIQPVPVGQQPVAMQSYPQPVPVGLQQPQRPMPVPLPGNGAQVYQDMPVQAGVPVYGGVPVQQGMPVQPGMPVQTGMPIQPVSHNPMRPITVSQAAAMGMAIPARPVPIQGAVPGKVRDAKKEEDEEGESEELERIVRDMPAWLVSLVAHMALLIILGLIWFANRDRPEIQISAIYGEEIGEQLLDDSLDLSTDTPDPILEKSEFSPSDLPAVVDPLAAPPQMVEFSNVATTSVSMTAVDAPIGMALTGREKGMKKALLAKYGGNATTEEAVNRALAWLRRQQTRDGSWSLRGPYADGGFDENQAAATAMALLAFQGAGHTHREGDHKDVVKKGWDALLKMQTRDGQFIGPGVPIHHQLYTHAQGTIAICELYGMTEDSTYRAPAERAIQFCVKSQDVTGGWRYNPASDSDMSVTGWFVMALQSAKMAKLEVPSQTIDNISKFLDSVAENNGSQYRYKPGAHMNTAMSAEGLLCRQYLGWKHDDPRLQAGANFLAMNLLNLGDGDVYYWYYGTQVMHHMEGEHWKKWREVMNQMLPETQIKNGPESGSWDPQNYKWGAQGGRLFVTCLQTYMLEVYYRHLPIYSKVFSTPMPGPAPGGSMPAALAQ